MEKIIHSFLLIGQSNMAGRGDPADVEPIDNPDIKVLRNGRWQKMYVPVNCDRKRSGTCLAESFADLYQKEHGVEVGLIPCADGGTRLEQWEKGSLLYDNAVFQTKQARRTSTLVGVLWHQGESDCKDERWVNYGERFRIFLRDLRKDLELDDVPFIVGELGAYLKEFSEWGQYYGKINEVLHEVTAQDPMMECVSSEGLTCKPDLLHFDSKSLRAFGVRYYEAFKKIEVRDRVFVPKEQGAKRTAIEEL